MTHSILMAVLCSVTLSLAALAGVAASSQQRSAATVVADIVRADYEADLAGLLRLHEELRVPERPTRETARIRYWRGFARWRRAINGVNDGAPVAQMRDDLQVAVREFDASLEIDPQFVDAKAGLLSSMGIQLFLAGGDQGLMSPLLARVIPMLKEIRSEPQNNPRMLWVLGQSDWRTPADWSPDQVRARQEQIMASYVRGLELLRARRSAPSEALEPHWGEPELLMNLAWSNLNKVTPDLVEAERYARDALRLVPRWHYVRDILLPQIEQARKR